MPPRAELLPAAIADLVEFMKRDDLPVLAHAAIAHAQFEAIHQFIDGNGRTGRALLHAMLRSKGLGRNVTVPISAGLLADTARYFASLTAYQQGDLEAIVLLVGEAAFRGAAEAQWLMSAVEDVLGGWRGRLTVRRALEQLEDAGVVREFTGRQRARLWVAYQITDLLDHLAALGPRDARIVSTLSPSAAF